MKIINIFDISDSAVRNENNIKTAAQVVLPGFN